MAKLKTIKEVLELSLSELKKDGHGYICNEIGYTRDDKLASKDLVDDTLEFFKENRPTPELHREFFDNKYYRQASSVWWGHTIAINGASIEVQDKEELEIQIERRKFLEYLIKTL